MAEKCRRSLSAAGAARSPAASCEFLDEAVAMLALNLDAAGFDGSARAAALLELRGERLELALRQSQAGDHRDALAFAALSLSAHAYDSVAGGLAGRAFLANAFTRGPQAI